MQSQVVKKFKNVSELTLKVVYSVTYNRFNIDLESCYFPMTDLEGLIEFSEGNGYPIMTEECERHIVNEISKSVNYPNMINIVSFYLVNWERD